MVPRRLMAPLWALLLLALMTPIQAQSMLPIQPFEASFTVYRYGIVIGEALLTLLDEGGGRYSLRSEVRPTGLLSMVSMEQVDERVVGEVTDGTPRPLTYEQQRTGSKNRQVRLSFDWQQGKVQATENARQTTLALQPRMVDPLSLYLLAIVDLKNGRSPGEYALVGGDRVKTYRVRNHGEAILDTPLGELHTLLVSRQRSVSDKITKLWHAPSLGFLPVQVAKFEQGKEVLRMTIRELKGIALPTGEGGPRR